jgi:hypothetical protein
LTAFRERLGRLASRPVIALGLSVAQQKGYVTSSSTFPGLARSSTMPKTIRLVSQLFK